MISHIAMKGWRPWSCALAALVTSAALLLPRALALECITNPTTTADLSGFHAVFKCDGLPKWQAVPALWAPLAVNITCSSTSIAIYVGSTPQELLEAKQEGRQLPWCGLAHLRNADVCSFLLSPFGDQYIAYTLPARTFSRGAPAHPPHTQRAHQGAMKGEVQMHVVSGCWLVLPQPT